MEGKESELEKRVTELEEKAKVLSLIRFLGPTNQVHIQKPQFNGSMNAASGTVKGAIRPSTFTVSVQLVRLNIPSVFSKVEQATVDSEGFWTAGPFRKDDGSVLPTGPGYVVIASSKNGTIGGDDDDVQGITLT